MGRWERNGMGFTFRNCTPMALSLHSVISVRLYEQQLSRSVLSIVMSLIFSRIKRDISICPYNDCILTSTWYQHASMSGVFN